jgi:ABC-type branched-subunit amino acid transport system ATPase component
MTPLLTVEGITKHFHKRRVLDEVGFSVRPGEVLGLIGPNGIFGGSRKTRVLATDSERGWFLSTQRNNGGTKAR